MKRSGLWSILVAVMLLAVGVVAEAQQAKKVPLIGYLSNTDPARESVRAEGIRLALRERGYVEGQNIAIEYRYAEGKRDRYPELAAELVRLKIDIIVAAGGSRVIQAAQNATKTIPIVMVGAGLDAVEAGLVESLARSGGPMVKPYTSIHPAALSWFTPPFVSESSIRTTRLLLCGEAWWMFLGDELLPR